MLYRQAEQEAADLRRRIRERRARLQRRERRLALLAYLVNKKKQPMQRYAQMNINVPIISMFMIVHKTVDNMMTIIHQVIHFPKHEELEVVGSGFSRLADHEAFGRAVGAIDGCHIRVLPPKDPQKRCYMNRKLFPSVILQGVCDAGGKFRDVYIGNPGSVHDSMVLRRSPMFRQALYPPAGYFLLGDGGYPCLQHPVAIMTPYRQPVATRVESRFNHHHAKARIIIERTFGMLKTRWRNIFLRALEVRPLFTPKVIGACCILHNICMGVGDIVEEEEEEEDDDGSEDGGNGEDEAPGEDLSGNGTRERIATQVSSPTELQHFLHEHDYN
uniref:putative nuclease HARBI1 n=1 Tax=Solea senegalensis TaxID=28829 RepID=UPI001CD8C98A|nr:putative nuclease HARBI1 [Solea senegalensis]